MEGGRPFAILQIPSQPTSTPGPNDRSRFFCVRLLVLVEHSTSHEKLDPQQTRHHGSDSARVCPAQFRERGLEHVEGISRKMELIAILPCRRV